MRRYFFSWFHPAISTLLLLVGLACQAATPLRIGLLDPLGERSGLGGSAAAIRDLLRHSNGSELHIVSHDLAGLRQAVADRTVDFVITNSGQYITLEHEFGISRIATLAAPRGTPDRAIGSAVLVRASRQDLQALSDLPGHSLMAVSPDAFGGWQTAWRELHALGISPDDLSALRFAGFPLQGIVDAVRRGDIDAGVVQTCLLEDLIAAGRVPAGELRVLSPHHDDGMPCLHSTRLYPDWPVAALRSTPPEKARRLAIQLLSTPATADGYGWSIATDYGPVSALMRELEIGPYLYLRETSLRGLALRYWPVLLGLALLLLLWGLHSLRVERQVQRRTAELRQAIAEREQAEQDAQTQREQLQHAARLSALGEMSTTLVHELAQPLAAIRNYAHGLLRRLKRTPLDPAALAEAGHGVVEQVERTEAIIDRVRHLARKRPTDRECRQAGPLLTGAVELFRCVQPSAAAMLQLDIDTDAGSRRLNVDPLQIEQVMLNLLQNTVEATRGCTDPAIRIHARVEADWLHVSVRDNGPGACEATLARLFEPFYTTRAQGLGLGLSICHSIIERHGGRVRAELADDSPGLVVTFTLPCTPDPA